MRGWPYWNTSSTADIETTAPKRDDPADVGSRRARARAPADRRPPAAVYGTMPVSTAPTTT
jgi:hypothetical protein